MRKSRPPRRRQRPTLLEPLEPRTLLSGLTIITHGAEFLSTARPGWIDSMAAAIRSRTGTDTAIYALRMAPSNGTIVATSFTRIAGPAPTGSSNDETVLLLDWAAASGVNLFGLSADYSTATVATAVMPYLLTANPAIGLTAPLVEGSIQLIGHSRGASLISQLAIDLGQRGIWVDQLTTLDPVPVPPDPGVSLKSNVIFADNYWQHSGDGFLVPNGTTISGAYNLGPLALGGAYGTLDGQTHGDVHLFYYGTINTASSASDGSASVVNSWYPNNGLTRTQTGYYYSRLGGGSANRPLSGISSAFGGTGSRGSLSHSGAQYANLATISLPSYSMIPGEAFNATYRYGSYNTSADITWYLDPDTNPYNNNSIAVSGDIAISATGDTPVKTTAALTAAAGEGTYYLEGRISNTTGTRYAYSAAITLHNPPPIGKVESITSAALTGWTDDPDTPAQAVTIIVKVDGNTFYTGLADLPRNDLVGQLGSANHGFSVDLSSLTPGVHHYDVYADDTTTGTPKLLVSRTVNTNLRPVGAFESASHNTLTGWALDPNTAASIQIQYQIDNFPPAQATASVDRPGLLAKYGSTAHGFSVALPQLTAGMHTASVWAVDATTGALKLLGRRGFFVATPRGNVLPRGRISTLTTALITGWAFDGTTRKSPIYVRIDIDGVASAPVLANLPRPDLKASLGGTNFGFSQTLTLSPGTHRIDLYALDSTSAVLVLIASRILTVPAP